MNTYRKSEIPEHLHQYFERAEFGLEETPEAYVQNLVDLFREIRRALRDDGTVWLNLGDSYASGGTGGCSSKSTLNGGRGVSDSEKIRVMKQSSRPIPSGMKPKDLIGIPWRVAFALQSDGWYLRQDIIWHKPNPMPESVTDRCTKSHEYIFLLTKSAKYYYDSEAVKEKSVDPESFTGRRKRNAGTMADFDAKNYKMNGSVQSDGTLAHGQVYEKRNKRSVWTVTTKPYSEAHFATYPEALIVPCIKAGCPEGGIVYDPFGGAGTTALVSHKLGRDWVLSELNSEYVTIAEKRLQPYLNQTTLF